MFKSKMRLIMVTSILVVMVMASFGIVNAEWPDRPINLIVPFSPGGGTDTTVRGFVNEFAKALGTEIVVSNMPGAGGVLAMDFVSRQPADGYTILAPTGPFSAFPAMGYTDLTYRDFNMIGSIGSGVATFVTSSDSINDMNDLIAGLKEGNLVSADSAIGGAWWLSTAVLANYLGGSFESVPYGGGHPAATAAAKGETDFAACDYAEAYTMMKEGMLKGLAIMDSTGREGEGFTVPSITEFIKDEAVVGKIELLKPFRALCVPAGVPQERMDKLIAAFKVAIKSDAFKEFADKRFISISGLTGAEADKVWADGTSVISWMLHDMGIGEGDPADLDIPRL